jgi:hypothetical protein
VVFVILNLSCIDSEESAIRGSMWTRYDARAAATQMLRLENVEKEITRMAHSNMNVSGSLTV